MKKRPRYTYDLQQFLAQKVPLLMQEGYPQKQALAIAFSMAKREGISVPRRANALLAIVNPHPSKKKGPKNFHGMAPRPIPPATLEQLRGGSPYDYAISGIRASTYRQYNCPGCGGTCGGRCENPRLVRRCEATTARGRCKQYGSLWVQGQWLCADHAHEYAVARPTWPGGRRPGLHDEFNQPAHREENFMGLLGKQKDRGFVREVSLQEGRKMAQNYGPSYAKKFDKSIAWHKKFWGTEPQSVRVYQYPDGSSKRQVFIGSSSGRVPESTYVWHGAKGASPKDETLWVHKHEGSMPMEVVDPDNLTTVKVGGNYRFGTSPGQGKKYKGVTWWHD